MSSVDVWTMGIPTWLHFLFCCWWGTPWSRVVACCPPRQKDTQGQEDKNLPFLSFPSSSSTQQKHCNLKLLAPIPLEILAGIDRFSPLFLPLFEAEFWANFDDNHSLKLNSKLFAVWGKGTMVLCKHQRMNKLIIIVVKTTHRAACPNLLSDTL